MGTGTNVWTEVDAPERLACVLFCVAVVKLVAVEIYTSGMTIL